MQQINVKIVADSTLRHGGCWRGSMLVAPLISRPALMPPSPRWNWSRTWMPCALTSPPGWMASQWNSTFWPLLVADFTALAAKLLEGWAPLPYQHCLLTLTNKRGLKGDLANRRHITLLCVDYKLLANALATCLCVVLPTCSILSRMIFENLYLLLDQCRSPAGGRPLTAMPKWAQKQINWEIFGSLWNGRQPEMIKQLNI